jgi:poly(beta-D-mannuronate) C5 epimerase
MVSAIFARLRATLGAVAMVLAPQAVLADFSAVDLSELRRALRAIESDVTSGINTPVDIPGLWASLPFDNITDDGTAAKDIGVSADLPSGSFGAATNSDPTPSVIGGGGLFALQMPQTAVVPLRSGIPPLPAPSFGAAAPFGANAKTPDNPGIPQDVDIANFRLMLASLSQTYTGQNAMAVVYAQGSRGPVAVSVRSGTVTLADIQSYASALGIPPRVDGTMTAPVIIWPGATLRLNPGDRLALARDTGAFVLSMGTLDIEGATIEVVGDLNPHTPSFVPFVTVAAGGSLLMKGATLRGLGFGQTAKFIGLSVAGNLLTRNAGKVVIRDSLFDGLKSVSIAGVSDAEISGNTFTHARDNTLSLSNAPRSKILNNLFTGGSHTNAIRVEKRSTDSVIRHNIFVLGHRVAMLITGGSNRVKVSENLVWKRDGAGVKFLNTNCGLAETNIILDNRQKGIEVRKSNGAMVRGNLIAGNGSAGLWVSAQKHDAMSSLSDNILVSNGSGLAAATGAGILLHGNDFSRQLPRLLDGDIARLTRSMVQDLRGEAYLQFKSGKATELTEMTDLCGSNL